MPPLSLPVPPGSDAGTIAAIQRFAAGIIEESTASAKASSRAIRRSRAQLTVMYLLLFAVGLATAVAAVVKGFTATEGAEAAGALVMGGLSAATFYSFFLARPLESLERNSIYSQWLTASVNSYWIRLAYLTNPDTIGADLEDATRDLVNDLRSLARYHAAATAKAPGLYEPPADATTRKARQ